MISQEQTQILSTCPLFKGIKPASLRQLISEQDHIVKHFSKNTLIVSRAEECKYLSIVLTGSVKGEMLDTSGKVVNIENIEAPFPYAIAFLFGQDNFYPVDVVAKENSEVLQITKNSVIRMMQANAFFLQNFLDLISTKTQFLSEKIWFISFKTIRQKIVHYFLELTDDGKQSVKLDKTQQELADLFGVTRPSLARVIGELTAEQLIKIDKKELTILNKSQLIDELE